MRLRARAAGIVMGLAFAAPVNAQQPSTPIEIAPTHSRQDDPNGGRWFVEEMAPSQTRSITASVHNNTGAAKSVRVYLKDLDFSGDGPQIRQGLQTDVGTWGAAAPQELRIGPRTSAHTQILLTVPPGAAPGDHIGAVVAETERRQFGVRIYVVVPGSAPSGYEIAFQPHGLRWRLWPSKETVLVTLRNTGETTLPVNATIAGRKAEGPKLLVSRHSERYQTSVLVPWYGGPVRLAIDTGVGERQVTSSIFVVPLGAIVLLGATVLVPWAGIKRFRRRPSLVAALHAETAVPDLAGLEQSLQRARRTGSRSVIEKLALAVHESGEDALPLLLEALERPGVSRRQQLISAAASYSRVALLANPGTAKLPPDVAVELIEAAELRVG